MVLFSSVAPTNWLVFGLAGQSQHVAAPGNSGNALIPETNDRCWDWDGPLGASQIQHMDEPFTVGSYNPIDGSSAPAFVNAITAADPSIQVLIVRCAKGGSSLLDINDTQGSWGDAGTLFADAVTRIKAAITALEAASHTVQGVHILWSQGFADAKAGGGLSSNGYKTAQINLLTRFRAPVTGLDRSDLQLYTEENYAPDAPNAAYGVSQTVFDRCNEIKAQQLAAIAETAGLHNAFNEGKPVIRANGWLKSIDNLHYSQEGLNYMGAGFAEYVASDLDLGDIPYLGAPMISHMFHRFKYAPAYEPVPPPAAPLFVRNHTPGTHKNASVPTATMDVTTAAAVPIGNLLVLSLAADNKATSGPEVSSIGKAAGETNNWVFLGKTWGGGTGSSSIVNNLYVIQTSVIWASGITITITYDNSIVAKAGVWAEFSGVTVTPRATAATGLDASSAPTATLAGVLAGDLVLGAGCWEGHTAPTGDADTTGGVAWSTIQSIFTTGGLEASNVTASLQYKIPTSSASQTYNPTCGGTPASSAVILAALQPV